MDLKQLLQNVHIEELTPMQRATYKACIDNNDIILLAPTGSGKTLAYLLPLVQILLPEINDVQAIILTPSRELALQTEVVFKKLNTPYTAISCYGGRPAMEEHKAIKALNPNIIIGTPGRINDHLQKHNFNTNHIRILIIDEFDKSLELGFQDEMSLVLSQLPALRQRILLSATDSIHIPFFVGMNQHTKKLNFIESDTQKKRLNLYLTYSPEKDKLKTLYSLLCTLGNTSTLIFVNYRESADRVAGFLLANNIPCDVFHGGMEQPEREKALYKFRNGSCPMLICTDLAARGLDIQHVKNVIHYHLPIGKEAFTHRNGRTARWQADGNAYIILHPEESMPSYVPQDIVTIDLPANPPTPPKPQWVTLYIGKGKKDKLNKVDIVGFFCKKGGLTYKELGSIDVKDHYAFAAVKREKVNQLLTLIKNEKIKGMKTIIEEAD